MCGLYFLNLSLYIIPLIFTDHFDYIRKLIGAESIGIGGDYEGATR